MKKLLTGALCICAVLHAHAQKNATQFKPISSSDFQVNSPVVDSNANAVVLMNVGSTEFEGNNSGFFTVVFKQRKRILLRNRNSFDEATVKIPIYNGRSADQEEKFQDFEATTYNLENGQVIATKLDKASLFSEKETRDYGNRKFTFPNIKEGSIIEYQYTIKSPFAYFSTIRPWTFQEEHPVLWSEYKVVQPYFFNYLVFKKGYIPYNSDTAWKEYKSWSVVETSNTYSNSVTTLSGNAYNERWVIRDVPAFRSESFTTTSRNHRNAIDFQLQSIKYSDESPEQRMLKDWYTTARDLMKDPDFGLPLTEENSWLDDVVKALPKTDDDLATAKQVFATVRDNIKCTDHDARWLSQPLKKTWQTKTGNVCDVNLLLAAMLQKKGFSVTPVLISTREHGYPRETTSMLSQFNYVVTRLQIGEHYYMLDASENNIGFGKLPVRCYNISGRVIDGQQPVLVPLAADSLVDRSVTNVIIMQDEKEGMVGSVTMRLGDVQSIELREKMRGLKRDEYLKELKKSTTSDVVLSNLSIDSLPMLDDPITVTYDAKLDWNDEDVIYFNPMLGKEMTKNPFVAEKRSYPVEMPYCVNETFILNMDIPKGYKVDEMPKNVRAALNNNEGMFEYLCAQQGGKLQFRSRLQLNQANFSSEDYETLRDFFAMIVKKQQEQIVFKKAK